MKNKLHITIFLVLVGLFLGIMFLSTTLQDVSVKYTYEDKVTSILNNNVKLGTVSIQNNGVVPAKVKLKALIGCVYEDGNANEVYISYSGASNEFINGFNRQYIEVSTKENKDYSIFAEYFPVRYVENMPAGKENLLLNNFTLYLFENTLDNNRYGFCLDLKKEDALRVIEVSTKNG